VAYAVGESELQVSHGRIQTSAQEERQKCFFSLSFLLPFVLFHFFTFLLLTWPFPFPLLKVGPSKSSYRNPIWCGKLFHPSPCWINYWFKSSIKRIGLGQKIFCSEKNQSQSTCWKARLLFCFLLLAPYVHNVAKRSIWDQCNIEDRPTTDDRPLSWKSLPGRTSNGHIFIMVLDSHMVTIDHP